MERFNGGGGEFEKEKVAGWGLKGEVYGMGRERLVRTCRWE